MTYIDIKRDQEDTIGSVEIPVATAEDLAERIRAGDRAAENEFVARFYQRVLLMARVRLRDEQAAQDVAQEAIIGALQGVRDGRLRAASQLSSYVCGTARNLINNFFRKREDVSALESDPVATGIGPEEITGTREHLELVRQALDGISPVDRAILGMTLVEGFGPWEIAGRLGMRPELVGRRKARAVKKLCGVVRSRTQTVSMDRG